MTRHDDLDQLAEALSAAFGAIAAAEPSPPSATARARLLAAARDSWADAIAAHFDFGREAALQVLADAEDEARWEQHPTGARLYHLAGGEKWAAADCGLVWMPRGMQFPLHEHAGQERVLVVQGSIHDSDGSVYRRGDVCVMEAGTRHSYAVGSETDLVFALVLFGGIRVIA